MRCIAQLWKMNALQTFMENLGRIGFNINKI